MQISQIINFLETVAPPSLQESYDNAGLLTGMPEWDCTGVVVCLDITDAVIEEAIRLNCNLLIAHHPIIFKGLKKIQGKDHVSRALIKAIKNDLAIFAIHTNLDNVASGVNGRIAKMLNLKDCSILIPLSGHLKKLICFVPVTHLFEVQQALFNSGAGHIGRYSGCSFYSEGTGTFTAGKDTMPYVGTEGIPHFEKESRLEVIFPAHLESSVLRAMLDAHPYEEVAYDMLALDNKNETIGSGMTGLLPEPMEEKAFLSMLKEIFRIPMIRHSAFRGVPIHRVALCGGAGSFLISNALASKSEVFLTADLKYHDFFEADGRILLGDIGHFESEQYTIDLVYDLLKEKFPTFAVLKTGVITNPINYFF